MNTDLELYRVFCEVVKYKNFSKAAKNMYVSQSAITQSIQKLEKLLGGKVFYRNKNGVELTEEGKNLYEYVKDSIETMSNAENLFSQYNNLERGTIRIGGSNSSILSLIYNPLINFIKKYPKVNISISNGKTEEMVKKLANGDLDIVVLNLKDGLSRYSNVETIGLKQARYCFFASKKYLKEHRIKTIDDIQNDILILPKSGTAKRKMIDDYLLSKNIKLEAHYEVTSSTIIKQLVLDEIGIGIANTSDVEEINDKVDVIKEVTLEGTKEGIATLKKNMINKATLELINEIKKYYGEEF